MSDTEFRDLVRRMRTEQRKFFVAKHDSTERREAYHASKHLEKLVDDELKGQSGLFDEEVSHG